MTESQYRLLQQIVKHKAVTAGSDLAALRRQNYVRWDVLQLTATGREVLSRPMADAILSTGPL